MPIILTATEQMNVTEHNRNSLFEEIKRAIHSRGLRNLDLAQMCDMATPKTSKLLNGRQKPSIGDLRVMAMALGYHIVEDAGHYVLQNEGKYTLESMFEVLMGDDLPVSVSDDIIRYEMPVYIAHALGIDISDYIIKTINYEQIGLGSFFRYRQNTSEPVFVFGIVYVNSRTPIFGLWLDKNDKSTTTEEDIMKYLERIRSDKISIPADMAKISYNTHFDRGIHPLVNILPCNPKNITNENIELFLSDIFEKYKILLREFADIDLSIKDMSYGEIENKDIISYGNKGFDAQLIRRVVEKTAYKCGVDTEHRTFVGADGHPYMEVVPIIPFGAQEYGSALVSSSNACCLCPMCASQLNHGRTEDREELIVKIYRKHRENMKKHGLEISLSNLLQLHGI